MTTGYTYEAHSDRLIGVTQNGASRLRYSYDGLGRLSGRALYLSGGGTVNTAYGYVSGAGAQATTALLGWYDNGFTRNTYTYDNRGNLLQKNEYALTLVEPTNPTRTVDYGYGNADWQDQLTSYNGSAITYDAIGNPTEWYNGMQMTWQKGR